jgi:hypothetical protein
VLAIQVIRNPDFASHSIDWITIMELQSVAFVQCAWSLELWRSIIWSLVFAIMILKLEVEHYNLPCILSIPNNKCQGNMHYP